MKTIEAVFIEKAFFDNRLIDKRYVELFRNPRCKKIYRAMLEAMTRYKCADLLTVRDILEERYELDGIGGVQTLTEIIDTTSTL